MEIGSGTDERIYLGGGGVEVEYPPHARVSKFKSCEYQGQNFLVSTITFVADAMPGRDLCAHLCSPQFNNRPNIQQN